MGSPGMWIAALASFSKNLCQFFAFFCSKPSVFYGVIFFKKVSFFPNTTSANVDSLFDNQTGTSSQKISRKIFKSCFSRESVMPRKTYLDAKNEIHFSSQRLKIQFKLFTVLKKCFFSKKLLVT